MWEKARDVYDIPGTVLGSDGDAGAVVRERRVSRYGVLQTKGNKVGEYGRIRIAADSGRHNT